MPRRWVWLRGSVQTACLAEDSRLIAPRESSILDSRGSIPFFNAVLLLRNPHEPHLLLKYASSESLASVVISCSKSPQFTKLKSSRYILKGIFNEVIYEIWSYKSSRACYRGDF